ncbi:hypothetical protein N7474_001943 [Penicillium riverlandense]|uniref:uncharacterized protein n=1 Tax=Penicillium riverlandense TaxID=1903569 RepID=UPI002548F347|nr:uncharacterized protein N7474_001943 [Penicillium riverlandense]KAJ5833632.1 hypothetical protein N7474_001943 [Penicillium riverlandense]
MLFISTVITLAAVISPAFAAECYYQSGGTNCVNKAELQNHARRWCDVHYSLIDGNWDEFHDSQGNTALLGKIGNFESSADCQAAYANIISECYGTKNGGSWTYLASLNIDFCSWPSLS